MSDTKLDKSNDKKIIKLLLKNNGETMTATYTCQKCNMAVNATCANCSNEPLVNDSLDNNGTKIQISKCPKCQGKIKSPMCCGQDMGAT